MSVGGELKKSRVEQVLLRQLLFKNSSAHAALTSGTFTGVSWLNSVFAAPGGLSFVDV